MSNAVPEKPSDVVALSVKMENGIGRHGADLGVVLITIGILNNSRVMAEATARGYEEARANKKAAVAAQAVADAAVRKFILTARGVLSFYHGQEYSESWGPTGFPNQSTAVPDTMDERETLVRALEGYFANHSMHEVAQLEVTAAHAALVLAAFSATRSAVRQALTEMAEAKQVRDAAMRDLRRKIRGSIGELAVLMEDDDARWYAFGLNPPSAPATPEVPEGLELANAGNGTVTGSLDGAVRADRYRVFKQIVGVDAEPVPAETVYDPQFMFSGLTAGQRLRVYVTAANEAGESKPSEIVEIVVT
jgi:hypothetical protein